MTPGAADSWPPQGVRRAVSMERAEPTPPRRRHKLLIVDDERGLVEALADLFAAEAPHLEVVKAHSGEEGLARLREGPVDAILSDYKMPGMNGLDFLEEARRLAPRVPRLLMTAYADLAVALRAVREARITTILPKPFDPGQAVWEVLEVLEARSAEEARMSSFSRLLDHMRHERRRGDHPPEGPP